MALRISVKRAASALKPQNFAPIKQKGFASQATAAASNLSEEARHDISVGRPVLELKTKGTC